MTQWCQPHAVVCSGAHSSLLHIPQWCSRNKHSDWKEEEGGGGRREGKGGGRGREGGGRREGTSLVAATAGNMLTACCSCHGYHYHPPVPAVAMTTPPRWLTCTCWGGWLQPQPHAPPGTWAPRPGAGGRWAERCCSQAGWGGRRV